MDEKPIEPQSFPRRTSLSMRIVGTIFFACSLLYVVAACDSALKGEWWTCALKVALAPLGLFIAYRWYFHP
jgi:uncharacterized membrane protein